MHLKLLLVAGSIALLVRSSVAPAVQSDAGFVRTFLRQAMKFGADDLRAVDGGGAVVKLIETQLPQEIALFGVVWIEAPAALYVERFRRTEGLERRPGILQIGRFTTPPRIDDVNALTLDPEDLRDLPGCKPGACRVQLPADAMERFRREVDWSAPDAPEKANRVARRMLVELLQTYLEGGNEALGVYQHRAQPMRVGREFEAMLSNVEHVPAYVPELIAHLTQFPQRPVASAEDFFYWSKVIFGLKPTIRVSHVTVYPLADHPDGVLYAMTTKQLYSTHYFSTAVELRFVVEDRVRPDATGFFLLYTSRSRSDGLVGFRRWMVGSTIRNRAREALERYLIYVKAKLEGDARSTGST